ncbi:response regulator transcription factor [Dyella sp.]|uniref:response regulator transcription factor n=1 Tax=Dyella sp. TaxID=1869338 RepID=UPI002ED076F2
MRVVIADDHPALLLGARHALQKMHSVVFAGEASNGDQLLKLLRRRKPDVAIVDYRMPAGKYGDDGVELLAHIKRHFPGVGVVALTMSRRKEDIQTVISQGIRCVVSKSDSSLHLYAGLYAAHAGEHYFSPTIEAVLLDKDAYREPKRPRRMLTERESEVIRLYTSGLTINEIAMVMQRSKQTISAQKASALRKLQIECDADLVKYPIEAYVIPEDGAKGQLH